MNEMQKKNLENQYFQGLVICRSMISYGHNSTDIEEALNNAAIPTAAIERLMEKVPDEMSKFRNKKNILL